jgi:hypothetical protein
VTVTNVLTSVSQTVSTTSSGVYNVVALAVGTYKVTITKEGFKTFVSENVALHPGEVVDVNASLQLGAAASEVTVTAAPVEVQTTSSEQSGIITSSQISNLSLNGRNYMMLAMLTPGVVSSIGASSLGGGGINTGQPIMSNGGVGPTTFLTDGTWNDNTGCMCGPNVTPSLDTIQEFRVLNDNYSSKYGWTGTTLILSETKSGTSEFHGNAYDYVRNDATDARNFFSPTVPALKQNIFGFTIGGPGYIPGKYNTNKKKLFFFGGVEWRRIRASEVLLGAMVPQAMRNGDFSHDPTLPSSGLSFDSTATNLMSQLHPGVTCLESPTSLNPACFDNNSVLYMSTYFPLPNNIVPGQFLNYINNGEEKVNQTEQDYRVDYNFSDRFRLTAGFRYEDIPWLEPANTWGANPAPTTTANLGWTGINAMIRFTANINPTTVNQFTVDQTADKPRLEGLNFILPSGFTFDLPYKGVDIHGDRFPNVNIYSGWDSNTYGNLPVNASDGEVTMQDDFTKVKGRHVIQSGALLIFGVKKQNYFSQTQGTFNFSGVHTGDPVADYLLGLDASFFQTSGELRDYFSYTQFEAYIQDDWKATRKLTLNIGLREVYYSPDHKQGNGQASFDPYTYNPSQAPVVQPNGLFLENSSGVPVTASGAPANLLNGIVIAEDFKAIGSYPGGTPGVPDGIFTVPKFNLGPRFGFAYDIFGDGKTAIRGGYGIGYTRIPMEAEYDTTNDPPFVSSISLINGTFTNPSYGIPGALGPPTIYTVGPPGKLWHPQQEQTWSFGLQRQLIPNGVLGVSYVGAVGHHLFYPDPLTDNNFPLPQAAPTVNNPNCLSPGESASPAGGFNFDPCINAGITSQDYTRPYVGWSTIGNEGGPGMYNGNSNYNALQASWNYRAQHFTWTLAYTFSKAMSDIQVGWNPPQNPRDYKAGYGPSSNHVPQVLTSSYVYQLPFLKGSSGWAHRTLGGWTFSGITNIQAGFALSPALSTATPGLALMPNCVASVKGPKTVGEWFNTAAFVAPAFGYFGNCGNGNISGPWLNQWNWSLLKDFHLTERAKVQFRAEAYNIWNHPSFNSVSTGLGSGTFGQLTGTLDPRQLEFALRLDF